MAESVGVVIVAFHPDAPRLTRLCAAYAPQADRIVVVDNTPGGGSLEAGIHALAHVLSMGSNRGIAAAFNAGMAELRAQGCTCFVLSDQDSEPSPDLVEKLLAGRLSLLRAGIHPGSVGARFVDPRDGVSEAFRVVDWRGPRFSDYPDATGCVPASFLISSASLVDAHVLDAVGLLDESLFIDSVDIEWSYRAAAKGFPAYGVPGAVMQHMIGDQVLHYWFLRWRKRVLHSPFRAYFQFRNYLLLLRMPHVSRSWKFWAGRMMLVQWVIYSVFIKERRREYLVMMAAGIRDGIRGRRGGLPE